MTAKERRQKKRAERKGLLWSDDQAVRLEANKAGFRAMLEASQIGAAELQAIWSSFSADASLEDLWSLGAQLAGSRKEKEAAYRQAWNEVVRSAQRIKKAVSPAPQPRAQVSMDKAGQLPEQIKSGLAQKQDEPQIPAWLIPAVGLALVVFLWRK